MRGMLLAGTSRIKEGESRCLEVVEDLRATRSRFSRKVQKEVKLASAPPLVTRMFSRRAPG